jgi:hypothetical protein
MRALKGALLENGDLWRDGVAEIEQWAMKTWRRDDRD